MKKHRGVALILVLVIVAMATVLASTYLARHQLDIQRAGHQIFSDQGYFYALATEEWAKVLLENDFSKERVDSLDEAWAVELPFIDIEGGALSARLTDMQSRFNLNGLLREGKEDPLVKARLLHLLALNDAPADLLQAIKDWLDEDRDATGFSGAEDDYYSRLEDPYLTANRALSSISELRFVRGMTDELYLALSPLLTALPAGVEVNVNTASEKVLAILNLPEGVIETALSEREKEAFKSTSDFLTRLGLTEAEFSKKGLSVSSSYFLLNSTVVIADVPYAQESLIYRNSKGKCRVLQRWRLPYAIEFEPQGAADDGDAEAISDG